MGPSRPAANRATRAEGVMTSEDQRFPLGDLPRGFVFRGDSFEEFCGDGPCLRIRRGEPLAAEDEGRAKVVVHGLPGSAGPLREALRRCQRVLAPGGELYFRVRNARAWHCLRELLDGATPVFAPFQAPHDPLLAVSRGELARALFCCGLVAAELVDVPAMQAPPGRELREALWAQDLNPSHLEREGRIEWYYVRARKVDPLRGSVLLAAADAVAASIDAACLERILPPGWEVVSAWPERPEEADSYSELWNRAFAASRGDRIWLLRSGQRPGPEWIARLADTPLRRKLVTVAPDAGCLSGLLIHRRDLLECGPLPWFRSGPAVAREEFELWLTERGCRLAPGPGPLPGPAPRGDSLEETRRFLGEIGWMKNESRVVAKRAAEAHRPWEGRKPRISLCMMTRDEEALLPRCLASAAGAVDEIVVVDTGSEDGTVAIAESRGARVIREAWRNDFSAPRNRGLRECTGDWILVLDADEELTAGAAEKIRRAAEDPTIGAYHLTFLNLNDRGERTNGVRMIRLFRNLPGIEYANKIHEQVVWSVLAKGRPWNLSVGATDVVVLHHGYTNAILEAKEKKRRNQELFEAQLEAAPDDHYSWYKYGDFLRRFGTPAEVKQKLGRALELILALPESRLREVPYAAEVATLIALEEARQGDLARAEELLVLALDRFMPTPNTFYIAAGVAVRTGRPELALELYDQCLSYRDAVLVVPVEDGLADYASWHAMGAAWAMKGFLGRAIDYLEAALRLKPTYLPAVLGLSSVLLQAGKPVEAVKILTNYLSLEPGSAVAWEQGASILIRIGLLERAREWLERAGGAGAQRALGELCLLQGDRDGAARSWNLLEPGPLRTAAQWLIGVLAGEEALPGSIPAETALWLRSLGETLARHGRREWAERIRAGLEGGPKPESVRLVSSGKDVYANPCVLS